MDPRTEYLVEIILEICFHRGETPLAVLRFLLQGLGLQGLGCIRVRLFKGECVQGLGSLGVREFGAYGI